MKMQSHAIQYTIHNTLDLQHCIHKIFAKWFNLLTVIKVCQAIIRAGYFPFLVTKSRVDNVTATTLNSAEKKTKADTHTTRLTLRQPKSKFVHFQLDLGAHGEHRTQVLRLGLRLLSLSRFGRGVPQSWPRASVYEVRAPEGDLAGELRAILCICRLQKQNGCPGTDMQLITPFPQNQIHRLLSPQDACSEADGARISGRRIRVTLALPRNKGPRNRFVADRHRGEENTEQSRERFISFYFLFPFIFRWPKVLNRRFFPNMWFTLHQGHFKRL